MSNFSRRKILETPTFLELFTDRFHFLIKFLHFVHNEGYDEATYSSKRSLDLLNANDFLPNQLTHPAWEIHRKVAFIPP
jgi:hypothetical protein